MSDELKQGIKTSLSWLELGNYSADPTDTDSARRGLCFVGTTLKQWSGSAWAAVGGAAGGVTSWDGLYDLDKTLTVDDTTLTFAGTHATNNVITITNAGSKTGDCLQITNSGTGKDIDGTSSTWSLTKAGILDCTGITIGDDETITFGDDSDATIQYDENGNNVLQLTCSGGFDFDHDVGMDAALAVGGDVTFTDSSLAITDADNATTLTVTNATVTTGAAMVVLTADAITDKSILYIDNGGASLTTGYYINCNDDGTADFTVGADGATVITTAVNSTKALVITGIQTAEDMVLMDNATGVIAADHSVLKLDAGGNVADGGNILRIDATGTPAEGSIAIEVVGAGKTMQGLYIDTDPATHSANEIICGGAIADNKAALEITADGTPAAAGSNVLRVNFTGTHTNKPTVVEINGAGKDCQGLAIDADPTNGDVVYVHSDAVIAADKAVLALQSAGAIASGGNVLRVDVTGAPASGAVYAEFDFAGVTDTHENVGVLIDATSKKVQALKINAAPLAGSSVLVTSNGVIAADKATVEIVSNVAACNADSSVLRVEQTATDGVATCVALKQDDINIPFITFESTIGAGNAIEEKGSKTLTTTHFVMVDIEGVGVRYLEVGTIA